MLFWGISKVQGVDWDSFEAKNQDYPDPTGRVDQAWIQGGCREMQDTWHIVRCTNVDRQAGQRDTNTFELKKIKKIKIEY